MPEQEQLFGYTGELPTVGYVEYFQAFQGEDDEVTFKMRDTSGHINSITLPAEKVVELLYKLGK